MKEKILNYIKTLGITEVGVAGDDRTYSAFVCLFPYFKKTNKKANISAYARAVDYHITVLEYLQKIADYIKELNPNADVTCHVDKGEKNDKYMAYLAGLGFFGKNGLIINEKYGSFVFIGYVLTDLVLKPDKPLDKTCKGCNKCTQNCPGKALGETFNEEKCASFISQKKGDINNEEKEILKNSGLIWGCDICQNVCPHNSNINETNLPEFSDNLIYNLENIDNLSEKEFKRKFGNRAFSWRGKKILCRNKALLIMQSADNTVF